MSVLAPEQHAEDVLADRSRSRRARDARRPAAVAGAAGVRRLGSCEPVAARARQQQSRDRESDECIELDAIDFDIKLDLQVNLHDDPKTGACVLNIGETGSPSSVRGRRFTHSSAAC